MKNKLIVVCILGMFLLVSFSATGIKSEIKNEIKNIDNYEDLYPVMRPSESTIERWQKNYEKAENVFIDPDLVEEIATTDSYSILDLLEYDIDTRTQGGCPNCWAWPSTAVLAIALNAQEGIKDRLSVQLINTCGEHYTSGFYRIGCCEGGNLDMFASFYNEIGIAIPWSNTNAEWVDFRLPPFQCNQVTCDEIAKEPNYPIYDMDVVNIPVRNVPEEDAIENIKNVLHQEKGVYFSVFYPDTENLDVFRAHWANDGETDIYDLDFECGKSWNNEEAAGHAMLIVGYVDDPGEDNDYWIVLNSWGPADSRPNGLLAFNMHMDYGCKYDNFYAFNARTLNISFEPDIEAPEAPTISGPSSGKPNTEYTYIVSTTDNQGDDVYYYVDWGDGDKTRWDGPHVSGEEVELSHTWESEETYYVRVKARDTNNKVSGWTLIDISMPRNKAIENPFLKFIKQFDMIYRLITQLIKI
jgi:C1A family cysteine protease